MHLPPAHIPVLTHEVLAALAPVPGECFVDCTAGLGGHACTVARRLGPTGVVVLNDMDRENLARAAAAVAEVQKSERGEEESLSAAPAPSSLVRSFARSLVPLHGNFALLGHELSRRGLRADMLLADLGFASNQMSAAERGFSFQADGPLDMRLDPTLALTAAEVVNTFSEAELVRILSEWGEERAAWKIVRKIVQTRPASPILTTHQLAELVRGVVPSSGNAAIHPATRTFQALRIAVNDELGNLDALLASIGREVRAATPTWLNPGARMVFISFHSLEDRQVKRAVQEWGKFGAKAMVKGCVTASEAEIAANPRCRSAKLRAVSMKQ